MADQSTMRDQIDDLMTERNELLEQLRQWHRVATMFYERHYNRRNCSLLTSCKACDAYEALTQQTQQQH